MNGDEKTIYLYCLKSTLHNVSNDIDKNEILEKIKEVETEEINEK